MKTALIRGAIALPLALCAAPALAQDAAFDPDAGILAAGFRPDGHGPAGTMADHVHKSGDLMIGLMWMHESYGGANRSGTSKISDMDIAAAGYTAKAKSMTMDMAMLHVMYAPNDRITLMLVPTWMRMGMTMQGLPAQGMDDPMGGGNAHSGHMLMPGQTMSHSVEGIGDTQVGALVSLSRRPALSAHAGLMVSVPTGKVDRRNADGTYVHYMMQGGSGTWDLNPSFTLHGLSEHFGWGAQVSYLFRAEDRNRSGFRFGDRLTATAWLSKPLTSRLSLSARLAWSSEGRIQGHYNGAHLHASPPDRQENYGGERIEAGLGANLNVARSLRLGVEASLPVHQDLNGIQSPKRFGANANVSMMF